VTRGQRVRVETSGPAASVQRICGTLVASALIAGLFAAMPTAAHAQASAKNDGRIEGNAIPEVPGDDIFGFTSTTDTGEKGDIGFANELTGFGGRRGGSYTALSNKMEFSYTPAEDWWVAASGFVSYNYVNGVPDFLNINTTQFEGFSTEIQYRVIKRTASNPFALAVAVEPAYAFTDLSTGRKSDAYGAAFKLLMDAVVVPDRVFWAANIVWAPVRSQDIDDRSVWTTSSASQLSTAVTFQLSQSLFIGAEIMQFAAYNGSFFNERSGYAYYLGPTLLWKITDKVVFNTTWQPQIAGRSSDNPDLPYELDTFTRSQFRFKLAVQLN
jgi:hypothetical protein